MTNQDIWGIENAILAIVAGHGIKLAGRISVMADNILVQLARSDDGREGCAVNVWLEKRTWRSKIGWYSSSSSDKGTGPCEDMVKVMQCAIVLTRCIETRVRELTK